MNLREVTCSSHVAHESKGWDRKASFLVSPGPGVRDGGVCCMILSLGNLKAAACRLGVGKSVIPCHGCLPWGRMVLGKDLSPLDPELQEG